MSLKKGIIAENKAVEYLTKNNFEIIERNFHSAYGEIDVIAKKNNILHFVEVKSSYNYEIAVQNITPTKMRKFLRTVDVYIKKHRLDELYFSIDLIVIDYKANAINFIENITL